MTRRFSQLVLLVVTASALASAQSGNVVAIRGVTLVDGTGRSPVPGVTVVIEGNRIRDVGTTVQAPAAGTDQSSGPALHRELELLVGGGISPADAIVIATRNAARALGKLGELGTIETGKLADLVLLKADPTRDINNAKLVDTVIKNGQIIDRSKLDLPVNRRPATRSAPRRPALALPER